MQKNLEEGVLNIFVKRYGEIDDTQAFENIRENSGDFTEFKEEILKFLKKN